MKGDFSRMTHRPAEGYSRVLMQQGRVQLDADWNEQAAIFLDLVQRLQLDLFGPAAGPADRCGFGLLTSESTLTAATKAQVKAALGTDTIPENEMVFLPGRYYVGGLALDLAAPAALRRQVGFPFDGEGDRKFNTGTWTAVLDVWEDYVCSDQDPHIRDVALGGVDTCGRARLRWAVRVGKSSTAPAVSAVRGQAKVVANPDETEDSLCTISPDARYRGAENQLYRIEIQRGTRANGPPATFKWSRDNGSVVFPVVRSIGPQFWLCHLGRDARSTLTEQDWVEVVDEASAYWPGVGQMAQIKLVDRDAFRVELIPADGTNFIDANSAQAAERRLLLRRWDHRGDLADSGGAIPIGTNEIEIDDGIKVSFDDGDLRPGEFWYAPARIATGQVDWPAPPNEFREPDGPTHFFAPLAQRTGSTVKDLRTQVGRLPMTP
jgi:hypothetical protein